MACKLRQGGDCGWQAWCMHTDKSRAVLMPKTYHANHCMRPTCTVAWAPSICTRPWSCGPEPPDTVREFGLSPGCREAKLAACSALVPQVRHESQHAAHHLRAHGRRPRAQHPGAALLEGPARAGALPGGALPPRHLSHKMAPSNSSPDEGTLRQNQELCMGTCEACGCQRIPFALRTSNSSADSSQ